MFNFLKRKQLPETGAQNARRFVKVLGTLAADQRMIEMLPHAGYHGVKREHHGWIWMANPNWRREVYRLIHSEKVPVKDARFHSPDALDGWSFTAISTTPLPRIATLSLEESLW